MDTREAEAYERHTSKMGIEELYKYTSRLTERSYEIEEETATNQCKLFNNIMKILIKQQKEREEQDKIMKTLLKDFMILKDRVDCLYA